MTEHAQAQTQATHNTSSPKNAIVLRIPKINTQVAVLGLVAIITLFQTFQLVRVKNQAGSAPVVKAAAVTPAHATSGGSGNNAGVPQAMVGGC